MKNYVKNGSMKIFKFYLFTPNVDFDELLLPVDFDELLLTDFSIMGCLNIFKTNVE